MVSDRPSSRADSSRSILLPQLSLFYPMFNEQENVQEAVHAALEFLPRVALEFEVIVVNDGSSDETGKRADTLAREDPRVRVVHHAQNRGYGGSLQSGIRASRYPWIFYTDGDNQFVLEDLLKFLPLTDPKTIITGYRVQREDPWHRKLNAWLYNLGVALLFGLRLRDVDCAFKLFPPNLFRDMDLVSEGAVIDVEILAKGRKAGFGIRELPVRHRERQWGEQSGARLDVILRAFRELFRLWKEIR
jgi:glycosyltransferase involved in cell wall biosynthesis